MPETVDNPPDSAYGVYMATRKADRLRVIDPYVIAHVIEHPARGRRWSLRELAGTLGCGHALLGHIKSGERDTVSLDLARRFSEAVGCEVGVLFASAVSTESEDSAA